MTPRNIDAGKAEGLQVPICEIGDIGGCMLSRLPLNLRLQRGLEPAQRQFQDPLGRPGIELHAA